MLKDYAIKVLHSSCQQIWKTQQWPQDWKRSVFIPTPSKVNVKEYSNYHTISKAQNYPSKASTVCDHELPDVQTGLEKAEEPEIKLLASVGSSKKQESSRKASTSALLTMPKPLIVCISFCYCV